MPSRRWGVAVVRGRSMEPTLRDGDRLLVRWGPRGRPGQVVVVRLPGDRPLSVKRLVHEDREGAWVERDNPREGVDSWLVGALPAAGVLGVVRCRLWPRPGRIPPGPRRSRARGTGPASRGPDHPGVA